MNTPTPDEIYQIRLKAAEVEFRAKSDSMYFKRLQDDPERLLREEGFDEPTVDEFVAQLKAEADPCGDICDGLSCLVTICCYYTLVPLPEPAETT
jgi:hypothetical protein